MNPSISGKQHGQFSKRFCLLFYRASISVKQHRHILARIIVIIFSSSTPPPILGNSSASIFRDHQKLLQPKFWNGPIRQPSLRVVSREGGLDNSKDRTGLRIVFGPSPINDEDDVDVPKLLIGDSVSVNLDGDRGNDVSVLQAWKKYSILYSGKQHSLKF